MFADYDGFYSFDLGEYSSNKTIIEAAKAINEHGQAYTLYANYIGLEYATTEGFEEAYCGEWDSLRSTAISCLMNCTPMTYPTALGFI